MAAFDDESIEGKLRILIKLTPPTVVAPVPVPEPVVEAPPKEEEH
jgi:hypothetical protein